jgi:hypothetical protein
LITPLILAKPSHTIRLISRRAQKQTAAHDVFKNQTSTVHKNSSKKPHHPWNKSNPRRPTKDLRGTTDEIDWLKRLGNGYGDKHHLSLICAR